MTANLPVSEALASVRSATRWGGVAAEHAGIDALESSERFEDGLHTIHGGPVPIDVLMRLRPGRPLILSFHGNTPRNPDLKLPVFTGLNVTRDLDASFVALSDPSLYLDPDLKLGWFAGSSGWNFQAVMKRVLQRIVVVARARDVVFFGGSGGGFASLYYSAAFAGSLALVWNPQTDIRAYNPSHVAEYGRMAFGLPDHEATKSALPGLIQCNLADVYEAPLRNQIVYLQNNTDGHVVTHMQPFLSSLGAETAALEKGANLNRMIVPGLRLFMGKWGDGHVPPSPAALSLLLGTAVSAAGQWPALLASSEFEDILAEAITPQAPASTISRAAATA